MKKTLLLLTLVVLGLNVQGQTAEEYYEKALEKRGYYALMEINKAIKLDPTNLDYRKFRARKLMTSSAQEEDLLLAIDDLSYVAENGGEHFRVYTGLMVCFRQLGGDVMSGRRPQIKKDKFGDNSAYNKAYKEIYQKRIDHLNSALIYLQKAEEMGYEKSKADFERKYILKDIAFFNQQIAELKD